MKVVYIEANFYLQCVALYSKNGLEDAKKSKLTAQLLLLIFPEKNLHPTLSQTN